MLYKEKLICAKQVLKLLTHRICIIISLLQLFLVRGLIRNGFFACFCSGFFELEIEKFAILCTDISSKGER